jgi:hypothetical protein
LVHLRIAQIARLTEPADQSRISQDEASPMPKTFAAPDQVRLPRATKGKRPYYFDDPAIDQMMTFFIELMTEVSVVRDRLDTVERLLDRQTSISRADIEAWRPDAAVEAERVAWRDAYVKRVLRMHVPDGRPDDRDD